MSAWYRIGSWIILIAVSAAVFPDTAGAGPREASISLGRDPEPPVCVPPSSTVDIWWVISYNTTPDFVTYELRDPEDTIVESEVYPGATGININRQWSVPEFPEPGTYWILLEYHSLEAGFEAMAEVTLWVCAGEGEIHVEKTEDFNCSGLPDDGDEAVANWWVCIDTPGGQTLCKETDALGEASWDALPFGDYTVYEFMPMPEGWIPLGPTSYGLTLTPASPSQARSFFNARYDLCFGACCLIDGECVDDLITSEACIQNLQGKFMGHGTHCDDVVCPEPECQETQLGEGWNCVSSYAVPTDLHMEAVWADVIAAGHLNVVKNDCTGEFCIPGVVCDMDWDPYSCTMAHLSAPDVLSVCGTAVAEEGPVSLETGWNCLPFFPRQPQAPQNALADCWDHVNVVKNNCTGEFCIPGIICNITAMNPGECYMTHMAQACDLYYPPSPGPMDRETARVEVLEPEHFASVKWTGATYSIVMEDPEGILSRGDEVGVFHGDLCVGAGIWAGGPVLGVTAWGDDVSTEVVDGCMDGDILNYRVWDASASQEFVVGAEYLTGDGTYGAEPYAMITLHRAATDVGGEIETPRVDELSQNVPNPFNPETVIFYSLSKAGRVVLQVFDVEGKRVRMLVDGMETTGEHSVHWDSKDDAGKEMSAGIYFCRIETDHFTTMKKMVLVK